MKAESPRSAAMPTNHVFVDFENVQELDLSIIGEKDVIFTLLIGPTQKKLDADLVERLLGCSTTVQLVRLTSPGKNSLDFALSYYAGKASANDPGGYIHIVSKDRGFDPLIEHLRAKGVKAKRHDGFETLTFAATEKPKEILAVDPVVKVLEHLRKNINNRPKQEKTLITHLSSLFGKKMTNADLSLLVGRLKKAGFLKISEKRAVSYHL